MDWGPHIDCTSHYVWNFEDYFYISLHSNSAAQSVSSRFILLLWFIPSECSNRIYFNNISFNEKYLITLTHLFFFTSSFCDPYFFIIPWLHFCDFTSFFCPFTTFTTPLSFKVIVAFYVYLLLWLFHFFHLSNIYMSFSLKHFHMLFECFIIASSTITSTTFPIRSSTFLCHSVPYKSVS